LLFNDFSKTSHTIPFKLAEIIHGDAADMAMNAALQNVTQEMRRS